MATATLNGIYRDPEDAYMELITPDRCRALLAACEDRPIVSKATVKRYAAEIMQGQWKKVKKRITLTPDGSLIEGHAELEGIIMAGLPVKVIVDIREPPLVLLDSPRFTGQTRHPAGSQPNVSIELITPEIAREWLDNCNRNNRSIRAKKVSEMSRKITEGRWHFNHQGIAFGDNGDLLDGQHRLAAIVQAGIAVLMVVSRGLPLESVISMDVGTVRTLADTVGKLTLGKKIDAGITSTAKRMRASLAMENSVNEPTEFWVDYITKHEEAIRFAVDQLSHDDVRHASFRAPVARAWYSQDRGRLAAFCRVLSSSVAEGVQDGAAVRLKVMFLRDRKTFAGSNMRTSLYKKTESALRAFLRGQDITFVQEVKTELFPIADDK